MKRQNDKRRSWREPKGVSETLEKSTLSRKPRGSKIHDVNTAERRGVENWEKASRRRGGHLMTFLIKWERQKPRHKIKEWVARKR